MQITDEEIIQKGENELIDAISAEIDWDKIEEIFRKEHKLSIDDDVEYKRGDIVIHNDQIAYQLEFQVNVGLSIILDRHGHYLSVSTAKDFKEPAGETPDTMEAGSETNPLDENSIYSPSSNLCSSKARKETSISVFRIAYSPIFLYSYRIERRDRICTKYGSLFLLVFFGNDRDVSDDVPFCSIKNNKNDV